MIYLRSTISSVSLYPIIDSGALVVRVRKGHKPWLAAMGDSRHPSGVRGVSGDPVRDHRVARARPWAHMPAAFCTMH